MGQHPGHRIRHQVSEFKPYFHLIHLQIPPPTGYFSSGRPEHSEFRHTAGALTPLLVLHATCAAARALEGLSLQNTRMLVGDGQA